MTPEEESRIRNTLLPYASKLIDLFSENMPSYSEIENVLKEVVDYTLEEAKEIREKRIGNIKFKNIPVIDVKDKDGYRRYSVKTCDDDAVMVSDKKGFWTPVGDIKRRITNES